MIISNGLGFALNPVLHHKSPIGSPSKSQSLLDQRTVYRLSVSFYIVIGTKVSDKYGFLVLPPLKMNKRLFGIF